MLSSPCNDMNSGTSIANACILLWCNIFCKWFNPMLRLYNKCRWISMLKLLPDLTWKRWSIYYSSCSLLPRVEIVLYIIIIHVSEEADFFWACQVTPFEIHQSYPQYIRLHHLLQLGHSLHDRSIVCTTTATGPGTIRTQKTPSLRSPCLYIPFKVFVGRLWPSSSPIYETRRLWHHNRSRALVFSQLCWCRRLVLSTSCSDACHQYNMRRKMCALLAAS